MKNKNQVWFLLEAAYEDLRPSEKKAADYILRCGDEIRKLSLEKLAKASGVSQPTVMRLMKVIGFSGYREFQYAVVEEAGRLNREEQPFCAMYGCSLSRGDRVEDIPAKITASTTAVLQRTLKSISVKTFQEVVEKLKTAKSISIYGVENSSAAASDLMTKLLYLGLKCCYFSDHYLQKVSALGLGKGDVAIGISYSGNSRDTVNVIKTAREQGACTIVITNFQEAPLCKYADLLICTSQEQSFYGDAIFSRTAQMMIVDMIYTGIVASDYEYYTRALDKSGKSICGEFWEKPKVM